LRGKKNFCEARRTRRRSCTYFNIFRLNETVGDKNDSVARIGLQVPKVSKLQSRFIVWKKKKNVREKESVPSYFWDPWTLSKLCTSISFLYCTTFYWIAIIVYCDREIKFKTGNIWAHHLSRLYSRAFLIFSLFYYCPFGNGYDEFSYQTAILITLFPQNGCSTFKRTS